MAVIGVLAALAVAATAFALFMNEANMAAANSAHLVRAELAARSGLEHAIRAIETCLATYSFVSSERGAMDAAGNLCDDPSDPRAGWYRYFQGDELIAKLSDEYEIRGRRFELPWLGGEARAEYVVHVRDLDGLLHANLVAWGTDTYQYGDARALVKAVAESCAGLADGSLLAEQSAGVSFSSLGELALRAFVGAPSGARERYALQRFFTVYPVDSPSRPPVNVNTAPEALLAKILEPPLLWDDEDDGISRAKARALAKYLCAWRPFRGRHDFEDAVRRVSGDDAVDDLPDMPDTDPLDPYDNHLTERQFNDILNNSAGAPVEDHDSSYDDPSAPGVYAFDGWEGFSGSGEGPHQTGGECSAPDGRLASWPDPAAANVTWSVELKFTSRFFHVYVLGRAWNPEANTAVPSRRCQAIYDAESNRVVWFRWTLSSKGSMADYR